MKNPARRGILKEEGRNPQNRTKKEEQSVDICGRSTERDSDVPLRGRLCPPFLLSGARR